MRIHAAFAPRPRSRRTMSTMPQSQTTISGIRMKTQVAVVAANIRLLVLQPADLDQHEPERLDLVQQPVELGLVAYFAAHHRLSRLHRGGEVLEGTGKRIAQPA